MSWTPAPDIEMLKYAKRRAWRKGFIVGLCLGYFGVLIVLYFSQAIA